jgi:hypothetical protein
LSEADPTNGIRLAREEMGDARTAGSAAGSASPEGACCNAAAELHHLALDRGEIPGPHDSPSAKGLRPLFEELSPYGGDQTPGTDCAEDFVPVPNGLHNCLGKPLGQFDCLKSSPSNPWPGLAESLCGNGPAHSRDQRAIIDDVHATLVKEEGNANASNSVAELAVTVLAVGGIVAVVHRGFSAPDEASTLEAHVAWIVRRVAAPSRTKSEKNPFTPLPELLA